MILLFIAAALPAQRRVDPKNSYYRIIAVVPLVPGGPGKPSWPKHVPTDSSTGPSAPAIIAFACEPTDDGKHAIIELVAPNRAALADVLSDKSPDVLIFEKSAFGRQQIESAVRAFRKNFSLSNFGVAVQ